MSATNEVTTFLDMTDGGLRPETPHAAQAGGHPLPAGDSTSLWQGSHAFRSFRFGVSLGDEQACKGSDHRLAAC